MRAWDYSSHFGNIAGRGQPADGSDMGCVGRYIFVLSCPATSKTLRLAARQAVEDCHRLYDGIYEHQYNIDCHMSCSLEKPPRGSFSEKLYGNIH